MTQITGNVCQMIDRSFVCLLVSSFVCSFVLNFVRSFVRFYDRSFVRLLIHLFVLSFLRSFVRSLACLTKCALICKICIYLIKLYAYVCIVLFYLIRSPTHAIVCMCMCCYIYADVWHFDVSGKHTDKDLRILIESFCCKTIQINNTLQKFNVSFSVTNTRS